LRQDGLKVSTHKTLLKNYERSASGKDIVEQLIERMGKTKKEVKEVAQQMLEDHIFYVCDKHTDTKSFDEDQYYQFQEDILTRCLNLRKVWPIAPRAPFVVLNELFTKLKTAITAATDNGKLDYTRLRGSNEYRQFSWATAELQQIELNSLSQEQSKGFFVSLYNLLLAHTLVEYGPMEAPLAYWVQTTVRYQVNMLRFSLWDIYHGILRSNSVPPLRYHYPQLSKESPQRKLIQEKLDARIHFCLASNINTALEGLVDSSDIEGSLQRSSQKFVSEQVRVRADKKKVELGPLFDAFKKDFGKTDADIAKFAGQFLADEAKQQLETVLASNDSRIIIQHRQPYFL